MAFHQPSRDSIPAAGNLAEIAFGEVLYRAALEKKNASLVYRNDRIERGFVFQNGLPVSSRSSVPAESLAKLSVVRGKTTREVVEGLGVQLLADGEVRAAFLAKNILSREDVEELLRVQLLMRLAECFADSGGRFEWVPGEPIDMPVVVNSFQLFTEGIAKSFPKARMEAEAAAFRGEVPHVSNSPVFQIDGSSLPTRAAQVYRRIDGRTSLGEIVDGLNRSVAPEQAADNAYRTWVYLFAFVQSGLVEFPASAVAVETTAASAQSDSAQTPGESIENAPGTVMVVTGSGSTAVAYNEIDDPELTARYEVMKAQNNFEILGIAEDVTDAQVKKAYFRLAKEFHPDRLYNHTDRTVKRYADKAFGLVSRAYEELRTAEGRKSVALRLKELSEGIDVMKEAQELLRSEVDFQKGVVLLRKKDFEQALTHFRSAYSANPREADHLIFLGWCEFQLSFPAKEGEWKEAVSKIESGLTMTPKSPDAAFYLASAHKLTGNIEKAEELFNRVLKLRPNHVEAQRELRLIEQRRDKNAPKEKTNLINKILK